MQSIRVVVIAASVVGVLSTSGAGAASQRVNMPGLQAAATVTRDEAGIAHIKAGNERDLFYLQGYVHAQDRLFQMDVTRRRASGTLAELLGFDALESDVEFRTIGLRRAAERSVPVYSDRAVRAMQAYAEGVNAYVARNPLPPEYEPLELTQFEPWTVLDCVTVGKLVAFGLSFDLSDIDSTVALQTYKATGDVAGFNGEALFFQDLFRSAPFDSAATIPDASVDGGLARLEAPPRPRAARGERAGLHPKAIEMGKRYLERARKIPYLKHVLDRDDRPGSNEWALGGELTESGLPLLANDPHLALGTPSTFYPIHLRAGRLDVFGSGFPGAPAVIVGHNRSITWGATVNPMDETDVYQEQLVPDGASPSGLSSLYQGRLEPVIPVPETFRANIVGDGVPDSIVDVPPGGQIPAATLIVPRRNNGPIISFDPTTGVALSIQYTGFSPTREIDAILIWNSARDLADFKHGLQFFDFGSTNFAYADVKGNIAYLTSAEMPVREDLQNNQPDGLPPYFIRNGMGGNEWLPVQNPQPGQATPYEILPFEEMPQIVNPPAGWFINANNDPTGLTLDNNPLNQQRPGGGIYYLNPGYDSGFRAGRLTELLRNRIADGGLVAFEDIQAWQADTVLRDAQVFVPYITSALDNARNTANPILASFAANGALVEAVGRLSAWDFSTPTGIEEGYDAGDLDGVLGEPDAEEIAASVAATLYAVWRGQFVGNVIDPLLEEIVDILRNLPPPFDEEFADVDAEDLSPPDQQVLSALRNLLDNFDLNQGVGASGIDFFSMPAGAPPADRRDIVILQSVANGLGLLAGPNFEPAFDGSTKQNDYRWGKLHRIVFAHPLGEPFSIPPAGGAFPAPLEGLSGIPTDGGFQSPDAAHHDIRAQSYDEFMFAAGAVNRFAAEAGVRGTVRAESIWPGGTSGVLGSPFYTNQLPLWLTNDTIPLAFRQNDLRRVTLTRTLFIPDRKKPR